jgi:8-oxo-dGTP diphosphatase
MTEVCFYSSGMIPEEGLTYAVIAARYKGKWIFIRHRRRGSFEIPGGHIEEAETAEQAAERELSEETGAEEFDLHSVASYSVKKDGKTGYGRLFFAEVHKIGIHTDSSEVEQVVFSEELPGELTYPDIQPELFKRVIRYTQGLLS